MQFLWPLLAGMASCALALFYGAWRLHHWRQQCARLQAELTAHRASEQRLEFMAHHDSLTGLPNRLQLQLRLEHGLAWARRHDSRLAVLFIDINRFKQINDALGHEVGDQLLVQFAARLRQCVREVDTVARQGGDEFVIVLAELRSADDARQVADKIITALAAPFAVDGAMLAVAASIGVAVFPDDEKDAAALIGKADLAMYAAKERRHGACMRFTAAMQVQAYSRLILETALRHALAQEEFVLAYQPRLDLHEQRVTGVKALLRWKHPELGLMMPLDFLPVLEKSKLIVPVGDWVLGTAIKQARHWLTQGMPLTVSVRLSAQQFYHGELAGKLEGMLAQAGLPGRCLELHIAEGTLIDRGHQCEQVLRSLKQLGVRIAISDFGSGHASLNYLRRFPVDIVKIDKRFIDDLRMTDGQAAGQGATVRAIIATAHTLNMEVLAGGVETAGQMAQLTAMGCDEAFGFCLSAAVAPADIDALLASRWRLLETAAL